MKAMLLLITLVSVNSFAGSYEIEYKQLAKIQQAERCAANPGYCEAMYSYKANIQEVQKIEKKLAKLEREKMFLCKPPAHFADHGLLFAADTQLEYMKSCKASMKYTEDLAKLDASISNLNAELEVAEHAKEHSRLLVSYLYAKNSSVSRK